MLSIVSKIMQEMSFFKFSDSVDLAPLLILEPTGDIPKTIPSVGLVYLPINGTIKNQTIHVGKYAVITRMVWELISTLSPLKFHPNLSLRPTVSSIEVESGIAGACHTSCLSKLVKKYGLVLVRRSYTPPIHQTTWTDFWIPVGNHIPTAISFNDDSPSDKGLPPICHPCYFPSPHLAKLMTPISTYLQKMPKMWPPKKNKKHVKRQPPGNAAVFVSALFPNKNIFRASKLTKILPRSSLIDSYKTYLVVSTHLKNIRQNENLPQKGMNIKHIWNHHPEN